MDDVIYLVSQTYAKDQYGVRRSTENRREVFAQVRSVTRAEFFDGGRNGLNPQFSFVVFKGDYCGETVVEYNNMPYSVYRTYSPENSDYMELYVERKGGTNGSA